MQLSMHHVTHQMFSSAERKTSGTSYDRQMHNKYYSRVTDLQVTFSMTFKRKKKNPSVDTRFKILY